MEFQFLTKDKLEYKLKDFCELYRTCFSDYIDENIVKQRYIQNDEKDLLMCIALDKGKIVANYSAIPCKIRVDDNFIKAAISLNTMTNPNYVGRGLFIELAKRLYSYMIKNGYGIIYGFPNYLSNKTFTTKLGWRDIYEVPTLECQITEKINIQESSFHTCSFNEINERRDINRICIHKDHNYLNWRYNLVPDKKYFFAKNSEGDWLAYKIYSDQINIVELDALGLNSIQQALVYIFNNAIKLKMKSISIWSHINTDEHYLLEKIGFINRYPIRYFAAKELTPVEIDIFDYRNWSITMGDDNVY